MFWQNTDQLFFTNCPSILFLFQHLFIIRLRLWILGQNTEILICPPQGICRHRLSIWLSWAMVILITWPRYHPVSPLSGYSVPSAMNKYPIERYLRMLEISSFPSNSPFRQPVTIAMVARGWVSVLPFPSHLLVGMETKIFPISFIWSSSYYQRILKDSQFI